MVVCCRVLFWYWDQDIGFLHAGPVERVSWSVSWCPRHRPCHTVQHCLQERSTHSTDSALKFDEKRQFPVVSYYNNLLCWCNIPVYVTTRKLKFAFDKKTSLHNCTTTLLTCAWLRVAGFCFGIGTRALVSSMLGLGNDSSGQIPGAPAAGLVALSGTASRNTPLTPLTVH